MAGQKGELQRSQECEFSNRIAGAWGAFSKHKSELTDKRFRLHDRLRLFAAVVTPSVLYGCETWTLRVDQQKRLKVVQRKMLRMVINAKRRRLNDTEQADNDSDDTEMVDPDLESWPEFLRRTAEWTEEQLKQAGQREWLQVWRQRQWKWACALQSRHSHEWCAIATAWKPLLHTRAPSNRPQARPRKRWHEDFETLLASHLDDSSRRWTDGHGPCCMHQWVALFD